VKDIDIFHRFTKKYAALHFPFRANDGVDMKNPGQLVPERNISQCIHENLKRPERETIILYRIMYY
jgi:hypothetical protein